MKVMVIGPTERDSFADNVTDSLRSMGHNVLAAGPARPMRGPRRAANGLHLACELSARVDEQVQRSLVMSAQRFRPDLTLTVDIRLRPATVRGISASGGQTALWFPDHVSNLGKHEVFLAGYDRIYLKNAPLVDQLRSVHGLPVRLLPEAANPSWHRPIVAYGTNETIVVAGNIHPTRAILLERLLDAGVPLSIYGPPISSWIDVPRLRRLHSGRSVVTDEKSQVFRSARAVLNNLHPAEYAGSNCRLFEAAACGAAVVTEWREGMDSLFDRDHEVLGFNSFDELVGHCRALLDSREFGRALADAAAARAFRDHTYQHRLQVVFEDLALA